MMSGSVCVVSISTRGERVFVFAKLSVKFGVGCESMGRCI